jgi:hypothetical protein
MTAGGRKQALGWVNQHQAADQRDAEQILI